MSGVDYSELATVRNMAGEVKDLACPHMHSFSSSLSRTDTCLNATLTLTKGK